MAHYDCSDCGASMGIAYGDCGECTPLWVFMAKKEYDKAREQMWKEANGRYAEQKSALDQKIHDLFDSLIAPYKDEYELNFEAGREWYATQAENSN